MADEDPTGQSGALSHPEISYISAAELRSEGYLQEVNRLFFHPLGLALEVSERDNRLVGIWDYREDAEGIYFGPDLQDLAPKAAHVKRLWDERQSHRVAALGWMVQPEAPERE